MRRSSVYPVSIVTRPRGERFAWASASVSPWAMVALLGALSAGCARGASAEDRQLAQLRAELTQVQADHDRFDQRLTTLEIRGVDDREAAADGRSDDGPKADAAPIATPRNLRVVRLGPPRASGSGADASPTPQTIDDDPPPAPRRGASADSPPRGGNFDGAARKALEAATSLSRARKCPEAVDAYAAFLVRWPDHPYADQAMFGRGECYFAMGNYVRAAEQYEGVIARFPLGSRVPDSLRRLGAAQEKIGNVKAAEDTYRRLQRDYPRSDAAQAVAKSQGKTALGASRQEMSR